MKKNFFQNSMSKQNAWEMSSPTLKALREKGVQNFFEELGDLSVALVDGFDQVVCMDEGTAISKGNVFLKKLCIAGSGILFSAESEEERIEKVAEIFNRLGVKEITAHDGCGAAKLAILRDDQSRNAHDVSQQEVDRVAHDWSEKVCLKMQETNPQVCFSYIPTEEMSRGSEFHNAIVVYFDFTGNFNPDFLGKEIPQGFVINPKVFGFDYALEELKVAIDIAFGHHGFGKGSFNRDFPFTIIAISHGENSEIGDLEGFLKNHDCASSLTLDRLVV